MSKKRAAWADQAKADLRAIDQLTALHILHTIARYLATGEGDVKRLQDNKAPELRLRVGDYRVRFYDYGDSTRARSCSITPLPPTETDSA